MQEKTSIKILLAILFLVVYFGVRIQNFNRGWDGSDANGHDVDIFVNNPKNPNYLLISRINGEKLYVPPFGHPGPMYEMFSQLGKVFQKFENYQKLTDAQVIYRAKAIAASSQLIIFIFLLAIIFKDEKHKISQKKLVLYFGIMIASFTPIAINSSNEFQIDSLFGFVMIGSYCIVLAAYLFKHISKRLFFVLLFLASIFVALGKNEWSMLFVFSLIASVLYLLFKKYILKQNDEKSESYRIIIFSFLGCVVGNLLSYLFEPALYLSGWNLLLYMSKQSSILSGDGVNKLIAVTQDRFIFITPLIAMIAYTTFYVIKNIRRIEFIVVLSYFISILFFFSFFLSTWGSFPRYFAPSFASLLIATSIIYCKYQKKVAWKVTILYGLVAIFILYQAIAYLSDKNVALQHTYGIRDVGNISSDKKCVLLIPVEDAYRNIKIDFVHIGMGPDAAKKIASEYGREMCPVK